MLTGCTMTRSDESGWLAVGKSLFLTSRAQSRDLVITVELTLNGKFKVENPLHLTPWMRVLLESDSRSAGQKTSLPSFIEPPRCMTVLTRACH
jgi:hypothetical protein